MDYTDLLGPDEPTARERAMALSAALRGQNSLATVLQGSGDKVLAPMGRGLSQQADQEEQQLAAAPMQRLKLTMMQRQNQEEEEARSPAAQAATGLMLTRSLRNLSPEDQDVIRRAPVHVQEKLIKGAQNVDIHDKISELRVMMQGRGFQAGSDLAAQKAEEARKLQEQRDAEALRRLQTQNVGKDDLINKRADARVRSGTELHLNKMGLPAGWDWNDAVKSGTVHPPSDLVKQADESTAAAGAIADMVDGQLMPFLKKHPNGLLAGEDRASIEPFIQGIQTMARKANDMGVYRQFDKPLLDKIVSDPTSIMAMLNSATGIVPLTALANSARKEFMQRAWSLQQQAQRVPTKEGRWGDFEAMNSSASAAPKTATPPRADGMVHIKRNGQTGWEVPQNVRPTDERL